MSPVKQQEIDNMLKIYRALIKEIKLSGERYIKAEPNSARLYDPMIIVRMMATHLEMMFSEQKTSKRINK